MKPFAAVLATIASGLLHAAVTTPTPSDLVEPNAFARQKFDALPLVFEALPAGEHSSGAEFIARGNGFTAFLDNSRLSLKADGLLRGSRSVIEMQVVGANPAPSVNVVKNDSYSTYFTGRAPTTWRTEVPHFSRITFEDVYGGIDLVFYGNRNRLEFDFVVAPKVDPSQVLLDFGDDVAVSVDENGDLLVSDDSGFLRFAKPIVYQQIDDQRLTIASTYRVSQGRSVTFDIGEYDDSQTLVIDPILAFSSFLGGGGIEEGFRVAADDAGNTYLTGTTESTDFPTDNALQGANAGNRDVFVSKIDVNGALVYSTYLGGSGNDEGRGVAVDPLGNVYLSGRVFSTNFPTVNPIQANNAGGMDTFLGKLNPTGTALIYSTYIGGSGNDFPFARVGLGDDGSVYLAGQTTSTDFPTTAGSFQTSYGGGSSDVVLVKVNPSGSALDYATYFGGSGDDLSASVEIDSDGNAYVSGITSGGIPLLNAAQGTYGGGPFDAFITKFDSTGSALIFATYLGGSGDEGRNQTNSGLDAAQNIWVSGSTTSTDFPTVNPIQATYGGNPADGFIARLESDGSTFSYSSYLGGSQGDEPIEIAVGVCGDVYVSGSTNSPDFPTENAIQSVYGGGAVDAFLTRLTADGSSLVYSTFLGGSGIDSGFDIALSNGRVHFSGNTQSSNFPITGNAISGTLSGSQDAFVVVLSESDGPCSGLAADAGLDQTEDEGLLVTLNGSASTNATNYSWSQIAGPTVSLSSSVLESPSFVAPYVATNTTLTFQLVVDDGAGNESDPDTVDVTVVDVNTPPVADAGDGATIKEGAEATLDGSNSFDPEGDTPLGYQWAQTAGPSDYARPERCRRESNVHGPSGGG